MNRFSVTFFSFVFSLFLLSCSEEIMPPETYTIKFGSECGWCAGQEYITITSTKVEYTRNIPCSDDEGITQKTKDFCGCDWHTLTTLFDYSLFKKLEYNECNVCADGCDEIIEITEDDGSSHELRYTASNKVEGMEDLRQKLNEIMEEMRKME